ncbi:signal transduction histidine-protein kinase/phosphatase UhpB [Caviibacterium pharyngocola]|uniref:signal transduction histidine-protein kinase/phosphatase UhpB n=1 Tax=Caviibacterium pharyngocola TaxID=28159 RepID=UPI003C2CA45C
MIQGWDVKETVFAFIYGWFLVVCAYFCLWVISDYLLSDPVLALLFLPFALRCGISLHITKKYWVIPYFAEYSVLCLLCFSFPELSYLPAFILSAVSFPLVFIFQRYYFGSQLKCLCLQLLLIGIISAINGLGIFSGEFYFTFLVSFTGGILIIPACYLVNDFLFNTNWLPLTAALVKKPITLRTKHILIYIFLFILNIYIQTALPEAFNRFSLFYLAIPIILLAFQYGWQGALLGTLLNSIALIGTTHHFSDLEITGLLLTLSIQTITGIFLGVGIQRQRDLNYSLSVELNRNKHLTRQLINTEESIRQDISRELHDEIGQNITAIRTQASILKRIGHSETHEKLAGTIEQLSLNIYDKTKGLLNRIRPRLLDDLDLHQALQNLFIELGFENQGIATHLTWQNNQNAQLGHILEITIYRLCQESLNNIIKYSKATDVYIDIRIEDNVHIRIRDNGIGFDVKNVTSNGFGIRGMQERAGILCGTFEIISNPIEKSPHFHGTTIKVSLPRN